MRSRLVILGCLLALVASARFVECRFDCCGVGAVGPAADPIADLTADPTAVSPAYDPELGFALGAEPARPERAPLVAAPSPTGHRIPMRVRPVQAGIPIGNGVFLPPLNGVRVEDGIPPIRRNRRLPPPGPVVAKLVDGQGQEWYLHEDGSHTSCSFASLTLADGTTKSIVSTQHGAVLPEPHGSLTRSPTAR